MSNLLFFIKNNYSWIIWFIGTFALSYFILHNTQWLIGDDAIVMNRTGSGIPFSIYDQIVPEAGRFFPLAYYAYNILLLFNEAAVTVLQHYFFVSITFVIFSFYIFKLSKEILYSNVNNKLLADTLSLLFTFMMLQRAYSAFSYLFGTIWIDFLLLVIFIYYVFRFIKTQKTYYAIIAFLAILYCIFCIEVIFIIPASFGVFLLLFHYKRNTVKVNLFSLSLVILSVSFLLMYYFIVYRYVINIYDGGHGSGKTFIQNAFDMLMSQKLLIVAIVLLVVRIYKVIIKKENINAFFDGLLITGLAFTMGGFILRLNWNIYYFISVIFVGFPIIYFLTKYMKTKYAFIVLTVFSVFYMRNYPKNIQSVQKDRLETRDLFITLEEYKRNNYTFIWRDEVFIKENYEKVSAQVKEDWMTTLIRHELNEKDFTFEKQEGASKNLYFFPNEYKDISWDNDLKILSELGQIIIATEKE